MKDRADAPRALMTSLDLLKVQALAQCAGNSQEHEQNDQQK